MTRELVCRYLAQTRLARNPTAPDSPISQSYEENFNRLCRRLGLAEADCPELFVAFTANAKVETLSVQGSDVIVYDQYLGQSFNRLNDFALAEWPAAFVLRWGFKHLGIALTSAGELSTARVALICADSWQASGRPTERSAELLAARSLVTAIQEYFVLAHEISHVSIGQGTQDTRREEFDGVIDEVVGLLRRQTGNQAELEEMMLSDELRALDASSPHSSPPPPDQSFVEKLREARKNQAVEVPDPSYVLGKRSSLREELLCDDIATQLTLEQFLALGLPLPMILASILHGFHNLASLTVIRDHARVLCGRSTEESELPGLTTRKSIWRTLMREAHGTLKDNPEVQGGLTEITELHARTVGDQFIFILPFEFDRVLTAAGTIDRSEAQQALTLEYIREFIDAQRSRVPSSA